MIYFHFSDGQEESIYPHFKKGHFKKCFSPMVPFLFLCVEVDGDNEPVETEDLSENKDEDHSHEEPGLLSCPPNSCVTHDADSVACSQSRQTNGQTGAQVNEAHV